MSTYLRVIGVIELVVAFIGFIFLLIGFGATNQVAQVATQVAGQETGSILQGITGVTEFFVIIVYLLFAPMIGVLLFVVANINDKTNQTWKACLVFADEVDKRNNK